MEQLNNFKNVKLIVKLENYLKREKIHNHVCDNNNNNSNNNNSAYTDHIFELNFEYSFFKLTKLILIDDSLITNENDLELLLIYCFDMSIQQYNLFQIQNEPTADYLDDMDEQDNLNIIELMNNFQVNLLNVLHCFSETYKRLNESELITREKKKMDYYDYMSAFVSIYLDISLELKNKLKNTKFNHSNGKHLSKENLCLNTFYLLDSSYYYACNSLLQLKNINKANLEHLLPILQKIIDLKKSPFIESNSKISKSLYLRLLLVYCLAKRASNNKEQTKFFKKFIISFEIPYRLKNFLIRLLSSYVNLNESVMLINKLNEFETNKKLRKYFFSEFSTDNVQIFVRALHNRAFNIKTKDSLSPIKCSDYITKKDVNSDESLNFQNHELSNIRKEDEPDYELEFTSDFSELTQYEVNSIIDTNEKEIPRQYQIEPLDDKFNQINVDHQFEFKEKNRFEPEFMNNQKTVTNLSTRFESFNTPDSIKSRYEEIGRRKSPTKENISRLNLFRNIFSNESFQDINNNYSQTNNSDYRDSFEILNNSNHFQYSASKFYKLNDLVSVMAPPIHDDVINHKEIINLNINSHQTDTIPTVNVQLVNDIQLAKKEFKKRKKDYIENNIKKNLKKIEKKVREPKKCKKALDKNPEINLSTPDYNLRRRLPNFWYYD